MVKSRSNTIQPGVASNFTILLLFTIGTQMYMKTVQRGCEKFSNFRSRDAVMNFFFFFFERRDNTNAKENFMCI